MARCREVLKRASPFLYKPFVLCRRQKWFIQDLNAGQIIPTNVTPCFFYVMTVEEYKKEINNLDQKIFDLQIEKTEVMKKFLEGNSEFKVGDKVRLFKEQYSIKDGKKEEKLFGEVFVSDVADNYFSGKVNYQFCKVKKDGTMSGQSAGVYSFSRLELVTK